MKQSSVEWLYNNLLLNPITNEDIEYNQAVFENAKVLDAQQERSYSEKEVEQIAKFSFNAGRRVELKAVDLDFTFEKWFEQFKKK